MTETVTVSAVNKRIFFAALLAFAGQEISAREWPDAGGWEIQEGDDLCFLYSEFQGPGDTELSLALTTESRVLMLIQNSDWSIKEDQSYKVALAMAHQSVVGTVTGYKAKSYPYKSGLKGGVSVPGFLDSFATSSYLHLYLDVSEGDEFSAEKAIVLDKLSLKGSAAALAQVRRCVETLKREAAAERARRDAYERKWQHIPRDPFSSAKDAPETPQR